MAMAACRECKKEVTSEAKTCPHCGISIPVKPKPTAAAWLVTLGIIVVVVGLVYDGNKSTDATKPAEPPAKTAAQIQAETENCKKDLQCWFEKTMPDASYPCQKSIEKRAKHSLKWTDGTFETKFSRMSWKDKDKGIINIIGDKVEFQNGFGAWTNMIYACTYDPNTQQVVDVLIDEGRL